MVTLRSLSPDKLPLVASWLARPDIHRWLDFSAGRQVLAEPALAAMARSPHHRLYLFSPAGVPEAIGLVGLSDLAPNFKTGVLWYVLGNPYFARQGWTTRAVSAVLGLAFGELGLQAVRAWAVECNRPSIRILELNNFRLAGRLRAHHCLDGRNYDRILFDLLAHEYRPLKG